MNWLRARLHEPSTYGGLAGLCLFAGVFTFTFWPYWRFPVYGAALLFIVQALRADRP